VPGGELGVALQMAKLRLVELDAQRTKLRADRGVGKILGDLHHGVGVVPHVVLEGRRLLAQLLLHHLGVAADPLERVPASLQDGEPSAVDAHLVDQEGAEPQQALGRPVAHVDLVVEPLGVGALQRCQPAAHVGIGRGGDQLLDLAQRVALGTVAGPQGLDLGQLGPGLAHRLQPAGRGDHRRHQRQPEADDRRAPRAVVVERRQLVAIGRAYVLFRGLEVAAFDDEAAGLAMQARQLVEAEGLQHDLVDIAQDVVQAQWIGPERADQLDLAVGRFGAPEPDVFLDAVSHRESLGLELRGRDGDAAAGGEFPLRLGRQAQEAGKAVLARQLGLGLLQQPLGVAVRRAHAVVPGGAGRRAQAGPRRLLALARHGVELQHRGLVLGEIVVALARVGAVGEGALDVLVAAAFGVGEALLAAADDDLAVRQHALVRHVDPAEGHGAAAGHGQDQIVGRGLRIVEALRPGRRRLGEGRQGAHSQRESSRPTRDPAPRIVSPNPVLLDRHFKPSARHGLPAPPAAIVQCGPGL